MYVFVLVLCFDGYVDGGGVCMPVQCWHCIHSGFAQAWLCNARMRRKAPRVLSPSLLAEALETRIPRDAWSKTFTNPNTYVLELVQEAKVIGRANKNMIQANYMIMEHLLSLNPTGIWKKNFYAGTPVRDGDLL